MSTWPLEVAPLSLLACGSILWRAGGVDRATVIAKASFSLVDDGAAKLVAPDEIARVNRHAEGGASLRQATELAPFLPRAGVVLLGSAVAAGGAQVTALSVRLALSRGKNILDKTLHVYGDRPPGSAGSRAFDRMPLVYERAYGGPGVADNPVGTGAAAGSLPPNLVDPHDPARVACFGPVPSHWPARRRLLRGAEAPRLEGVVAIPDGFDWTWFDPSPSDQRVEYLRGDEWLTLDGMSAARSRIQARLPGARVRARYRLVGGAEAEEPARAIEMSADTLSIDADRLVCSIVWRGSFPVAGELARRVRVGVGLELAGAGPVAWPDAYALSEASTGAEDLATSMRVSPGPTAAPAPPLRIAAPPSPPPAPPPPDEPEDPFQRTKTHDFAMPARPALPFRPSAEEDEGERFAGTAQVDVASLARAALPFQAPRPAPPAAAPTGAEAPACPTLPPPPERGGGSSS